MLKEKATEATTQILGLLGYSRNTYFYISIQPIILKFLESIYVQARKDQLDKVPFSFLKDGSITFNDE